MSEDLENDFNEPSELTQEIDTVGNYIKWAGEENLETEVVAWALMSMKNDSSLTIVEAMQCGFDEWVK